MKIEKGDSKNSATLQTPNVSVEVSSNRIQQNNLDM